VQSDDKERALVLICALARASALFVQDTTEGGGEGRGGEGGDRNDRHAIERALPDETQGYVWKLHGGFVSYGGSPWKL